MSSLTLGDLQLGLNDLLIKRSAALLLAPIGAVYAPMLTAKRDALSALPPALTGAPLAEQLSTADAAHDGFAAAVYHVTDGYLHAPGVSSDLVAAANRVRANLVPALKIVRDSYATKAANALDHKPKMAGWKADLDLFPLAPVAGAKTLWDWASAYVDAGVQINTLLSQRADADDGARAAAGKLRTETLGLLTRLRAGVADSMAHDPKLPSNLDAQLFAYLDQLEATRDGAIAASAAEVKKSPAKQAAADKAAADKAIADKAVADKAVADKAIADKAAADKAASDKAIADKAAADKAAADKAASDKAIADKAAAAKATP